MFKALDDQALADLILKEKPDVFRFFYSRGWVTLRINTTIDGVDVPANLGEKINIRVGLNLPLPTKDIRIGRSGLRTILFFQGRPYPCVLPWESVIAIIGQEDIGLMWTTERVLVVKRRVSKPTLLALDGGLDINSCAPEVEAQAQEQRAKFEYIEGDVTKKIREINERWKRN